MSLVEVTREQREWASRILAFAGDGQEPDHRQDGEQDTPTTGSTSGSLRYGEGLKERDWLAPDDAELPTSAFRDAVDPNKPPKMLTVNEWREVVKSRQQPELPENKEDREKIKKDLDNWEANQGKEEELAPIRKQAMKCLPLLNAPQNNPEMSQVETSLQTLEELEKEYKKPLTKKQAQQYTDKKCKLLYELQATIFTWNDRRMSQNLPPSPDAFALADVLQRVHQEVTQEIIDQDLPLPLSPEDDQNLTQEEKVKIQETWKNLVMSGKGGKPGKGSRLIVKEPEVQTGGLIKDRKQAKQFRLETLSNFGRLLQSEAGRHLVDKINQGERSVVIEPSTEAECKPGIETESFSGGKGTGSTVGMVLGAKDSRVCSKTKDGNLLFNPRFITLGHELTHALHMSRAINLAGYGVVPEVGTGGEKGKGVKGEAKTVTKWQTLSEKDQDAWNNPEEFHTILVGKTSEVTLRSQYGLSTERFGHKRITAKQTVANSFKKSLEVAEKLEELNKQKPTVVEALTARGFKPESLTDEMKLALFNAQGIDGGKIPPGWDLNKLTIEQVQEVVKSPAIEYRLDELGWAPYGLTGTRLREITAQREHHPRSPRGRRFQTLGGEESWARIPNFNSTTKLNLAVGKQDNWESRLDALEDAAKMLDNLAKRFPRAEIREAAGTKDKVGTRLDAVAKTWTQIAGENQGVQLQQDTEKWLDIQKQLSKQFSELGGEPVIQVIAGLKVLKGKLKLETGDPNDISSRIKAIQSAGKTLTDFTKNAKSPEVIAIAKKNRPLAEALKLIEEVYVREQQAQQAGERQKKAGEEIAEKGTRISEVLQAYDARGLEKLEKNTKAKKSAFQAVIEAMGGVARGLQNLPTKALGYETFQKAIRSFVETADRFRKDHTPPRSRDDTARLTACDTMVKDAQKSATAVDDVRITASDIVKTLTADDIPDSAFQKQTDPQSPESAIKPLQRLLESPYLGVELRQELVTAVNEVVKDAMESRKQRLQDLEDNEK